MGLKETYLQPALLGMTSLSPVGNAGGGLQGGNHFLVLPSVLLSHGDDRMQPLAPILIHVSQVFHGLSCAVDSLIM